MKRVLDACCGSRMFYFDKRDPDVIFADEPTGNLDSQSGREVMDLLASVHREFGKTIVVITHDDRIAQMAERKFSIVDGILSEVSRR